MGYVSVMMVLEDAWEDIKKDPDYLLKAIETGMNAYNGKPVNHFGMANYSYVLAVHRSVHSSQPQLLLAKDNELFDLTDIRPDFQAAGRGSMLENVRFRMEYITDAEQYLKETKEALIKAAADDMKDLAQCFLDNSEDHTAENIRTYVRNSDWVIKAGLNEDDLVNALKEVLQ